VGIWALLWVYELFCGYVIGLFLRETRAASFPRRLRVCECHTRVWVHLWMSRNEWVSHDKWISVTRLIHLCYMTHSYVWHSHMNKCHTTNEWVSHDSFICATQMNESCVRVTRVWVVVCECRTTHSFVLHDSFIRVKWLIHTRDMTLSSVRHDLFMCVFHDSFIWDEQPNDAKEHYFSAKRVLFLCQKSPICSLYMTVRIYTSIHIHTQIYMQTYTYKYQCTYIFLHYFTQIHT